MSILKALQKKQSETIEDTRVPAENGGETAVEMPFKTGNVVPFSKDERINKEARNNAQFGGIPADFFSNKEIKIGTPSLASNGHSDSQNGKALLDLRSETNAGATLDAVGTTRPVIKTAPEFVRWSIEAERVEPRLVTITHPHSSYCEEYRSLRTHILHRSQKQKLQAIVVASVNASEGKSVTALNFSWLLAQTDGVRALIIDADLRMPSLTDYLGIETDKGLSHILSEEASLKDSIIRLEPSGLHLLPGGEARNDVAELLSGPKFREILREAREMFDYVIIDAPPLGIFTDAAVLINHADGAMIVVRANRTRYSLVERALENVARERLLGVILNQSEDVMDESQYNYGYYNYNRQIKD